ncbi:MAG: [FeFe] hydrogenase, group A [Patescibacteria group bacterium]|nr:[FeFe] hydrogenase, group A [Patescibacteria group bacterium]
MKEKNKISVIIDGKKYRGQAGQTILSLARKNEIKISALCYHPDLKIQGSCRLCLVEIVGRSGLFTSCSTLIEEGMKIITSSPAINKAKQVNLELIFSQHCLECGDCLYNQNCNVRDFAKKYKVNIAKFPDRKKGFPTHYFSNALEFDTSKCIDCGLCVEACHKVGVDFLELKKKKNFYEVVPSVKKDKDCIYCGQCLTHCPVGAFEGIGEFESVKNWTLDKKKTVVFQFAPSIRSTIGEEFGLEPGTVVTGQLIAAIKKLGVKHVFDVSLGADVTTIEEARELVDRIKNNKPLPMFTSCCPAWVKYVEFYQPELMPYLTTVRSPEIIMGGLIKYYWAKKQGLNPKDVIVVSIMPCVAKKYEIARQEFKVKGIRPVDQVLTTRELAFLLRSKKIDLKKIKESKAVSTLGVPTGAGVIYGASGGVMESALRTAYHELTGKNLGKVEFEKVRGIEGFKKANIKIGKKIIRVAVVNAIVNAKKVLAELKKNPQAYDYVEVMACFGGCIGGGGQPVPVDDEIRKKRSQGLYNIDKKHKIRSAQQNPVVKTIYKEFLNQEKNIHRVCHTYFRKKKKEVYPLK